jgi:nitrogen regulatory protein PII
MWEARGDSPSMRKVEALVLPEYLGAIQLALADSGLSGLSVFECGQFEEVRETDSSYSYVVSPRIKVEIFCEDHESSRVSQIFSSETSSKTADPARVFVTEVEETIRIRPPYVPPRSNQG